MIYDRKRDPENRDLMTFEEDGETFSTYFLLPRTREDLQRRFETQMRFPVVRQIPAICAGA
jgi:4-hydroxyphenylacetate 3-monooxygenase